MSKAAQAVEAAVKQASEKQKAPKEPKAAKAPREPKERDPLAGIRATPKLKGLLLTTSSQALVKKCIEAAVSAGLLSGADANEAARLKARIEARQ